MSKSMEPRPNAGAAMRRPFLNDFIARFAPGLALAREANAARRSLLVQNMGGNYDGAGRGRRGADFRVNRSDAIESMRADRDRMSWIGRDMVRNNPRVVKIVRQLSGNVVGAGIVPSVRWLKETPGRQNPDRKIVENLLRRHCTESTAIDADGLRTIYGLQSGGFAQTVVDGEVLFRRLYRRRADGYPLNFQIQMLEADYLDRNVDGDLPGGGFAVQGIEFNKAGQRVAYHLHRSHPGGRGAGYPDTVRVEAEHVIHAFDPLRAGQQRGITWLAPVITLLHDLQKYQDGQVKRQEIASMFAGIYQSETPGAEMESQIGELSPGAILPIGHDESIEFTNPPSVDGYEPFMRVTDRTIAGAMGLTYEGFTGDYSSVNYTSGRMGRMDIDPQIRGWQQNLMIAQISAGFGRWISEAIEDQTDIGADDYGLVWTPPTRPLLDPTKDYKAYEIAMRSGQKARRQVIRETGGDPDKVDAEISEERAWARGEGVVFTSDAGASAQGGGAESPAKDTNEKRRASS